MGQINEALKEEKFAKICGDDLLLSLNDGDAESVRRWVKKASKRFRNTRELWEAVRYGINNVDSWGRYRAMAELAVKQIELAQEMKSECIQSGYIGGESFVSINAALAESYLSLARSNLRLSDFLKSTDYCNKGLTFISKCRGDSSEVTSQIVGEVHLCRGSAQLRMGNYRNALEDLERALSVSNTRQNTDLECMSCCALGRVYLDLKDFEKAAMKYALESGDRGSQAYCLLSFADIHRAKRDPDKAFPRYESALSVMREVGDRYGETKALAGKAKMHLKNKNYLETTKNYRSAIKIAVQMNAKMECLNINGELALTYQRMRKVEDAREHLELYHKLLKDMDLYCGACEEPISEKHQQLEALPCSHIFHLTCVSEHGFINTKACPKCRKMMRKPLT